MSVNRLNIISAGDNVGGSYDLYRATANDKAGALRYSLPFGHSGGVADGVPDFYVKDPGSWLATAIGGAAGNAISNVAPTATQSNLIRFSSGTVITTGSQYNNKVHAGSLVSTPFFVRNGSDGLPNKISGRFNFQWSHNDLAWLLGITDNTAQLSTGGAVAGTDGLFLYKAAGSANIVAHVRSGSTSTTTTLDTGATAGVMRKFGFILDPSTAIVMLDQAGVEVETSILGFTAPAVALGISLAVVNSSANSRNFDLSRCFCSQEAYS